MENLIATVDRVLELDALSAAYKILDRASEDVAGQPSLKVFMFVRDARNHVRKQVEEIIAPIFEQ